MKRDLVIIFLLGVLFFLIDINTFSYCKREVYPVLLIHHIVNIFAQFGFLSNDKTLLSLYVVAPLLTMIHWKTNDNKCFLTELVNESCGYEMYFRDIWFLLGVKDLKYYSQLHYGYLFIGWIIAVVKLTRLLKV
jgi:hypothetical protein